MPTPAGPDTNQFRCNACGRWFNTQAQLSAHEPECRHAKAATETGHRNLEEEDRTDHSPNDHDSSEHPFRHGTQPQR